MSFGGCGFEADIVKIRLALQHNQQPFLVVKLM
jgi:hypothetical protein